MVGRWVGCARLDFSGSGNEPGIGDPSVLSHGWVTLLPMATISIRELRHNLGHYMARVERGEGFEVTNHGRLVAFLNPAVTDPWERLIASGHVRRAISSGHLGDIDPGDSPDSGMDALWQLRGRQEP